jgi:REP element-mobilizing transposase RayT
MVIAYHAIFAAYGFWLPNEERGSWSTEVWAPHLKTFGPATKTTERRSLANRSFDREKRRAARDSLKYRPVRFNGLQARAIERGFADIAAKLNLQLYACAIMHDHVHIVPRRHRLPIEEIVGHLKRAATRELNREDLHPLADHRSARGRVPSPWVENGWFRYLDNEDAVVGAIDYVWSNPTKIGLRHQPWWFLTKHPHWSPKTPRSRGG